VWAAVADGLGRTLEDGAAGENNATEAKSLWLGAADSESDAITIPEPLLLELCGPAPWDDARASPPMSASVIAAPPRAL
jgi:hypothetical protein